MRVWQLGHHPVNKFKGNIDVRLEGTFEGPEHLEVRLALGTRPDMLFRFPIGRSKKVEVDQFIWVRAVRSHLFSQLFRNF